MWKVSFQDQGFHKIAKKTHVQRFFQFLILNISSIKWLLHKPLKIQWNITGKQKRKLFWALSYKILPPEITKTWEIALLGIFWGRGNKVEFNVFFMIFWISESFSLYLLVKNSFNFKVGFFTYFEYISGVSSEKTFYVQILIVTGDIEAKKTRKTSHKLHINFFLNA